MSEEPMPAEGGAPAGEEWPRLNGSSHGTPGSLAGAARQASDGGDLSLEEESEGTGPGLARNEDPLIPEVFRETIPPPPRGWSEDRWRQSFLGNEQPVVRGQGLNFGRVWLLALVFAIVALVLVIVIALAH